MPAESGNDGPLPAIVAPRACAGRSARPAVPGPAARILAALLTLNDRVIAPLLTGVRRG